MKTRGLKKKSLFRYWIRRLPDQEQMLERFQDTGLSIRDFYLGHLELVCACSLMLETRSIYEVNQAINRLLNESVENILDEVFFDQLDSCILDLEKAGMRGSSRKLRKLGQGLAAARGSSVWQTKWKSEADTKITAAIKDEPFLPQ